MLSDTATELAVDPSQLLEMGVTIDRYFDNRASKQFVAAACECGLKTSTISESGAKRSGVERTFHIGFALKLVVFYTALSMSVGK